MPAWKKNNNLVASTTAFLKNQFDKDLPTVIVDVRPADVAVKEHAKGAINIPLAELDKFKDKFPKDKSAPIVIYCASTEAMQKAFSIIRPWGYNNVSYLEGGWEAYKKAGLPVASNALVKEINYVPKLLPGEISVDEFRKIAQSTPADKLILDVRDEEEAAEGMIKGAKNIPTQDIKQRLAEIPKGKEIIVHCSTGVRAEIAYNILKEAGIKVRYLNANVHIDKSGKFDVSK